VKPDEKKKGAPEVLLFSCCDGLDARRLKVKAAAAQSPAAGVFMRLY